MDYLQELGGLALASRMRRLADAITADVATIYKNEGIDFEPRWFSIFHLLGMESKLSIVDIASKIGVTHQFVNQMAEEMLKVDLLSASTDPKDRRKRLLSLSDRGRRLHTKVKQLWRLMRLSVSEYLTENCPAFLEMLQALEAATNNKELLKKFKHNKAALQEAEIKLIDFRPQLKEHFYTLNESWLKKFFSVEKADKELLAHPEKIIAAGGIILFAQLDKNIIGTCALVKKSETEYDLQKMAVAEDFQGRGIGSLLMNECLQRAKDLGAHLVTLETSTKLKSAIKLYKTAGFKTVRSPHKPSFSRVDLYMELGLKAKHTS